MPHKSNYSFFTPISYNSKLFMILRKIPVLRECLSFDTKKVRKPKYISKFIQEKKGRYMVSQEEMV